MADGVDKAPKNEIPEDEGPQDDVVSPDEVSENGTSPQPEDAPVVEAGVEKIAPAGEALGRKAEEFHRPPTRMERLRAWLERLPRVRLYAALLFIVWFSLTLLIGVDVRPTI